MSSEIENLLMMSDDCSRSFRYRITFVVVKSVFNNSVKVQQFYQKKKHQQGFSFWLDELSIVSVQKNGLEQSTSN